MLMEDEFVMLYYNLSSCSTPDRSADTIRPRSEESDGTIHLLIGRMRNQVVADAVRMWARKRRVWSRNPPRTAAAFSSSESATPSPAATSTPPSSTRSGSAACCRWCVGARRCGARSRSSTPRFASATSPVPGRASTAWDAAGRTCARPRWEATPPVRGCSRARRAAPDRALPPPDPRRRAAP